MKSKKVKKAILGNCFLLPLVLFTIAISIFALYTPQTLKTCGNTGDCSVSTIRLTGGQCGTGSDAVSTSIDFGCYGDSCTSSNNQGYCAMPHNGIVDLVFAIVRFLSDGVGLVVILSVIIGGIQYITSKGDPNATQGAIKRLTSAVTALLIYIFAYAILNYVVPGAFFK